MRKTIAVAAAMFIGGTFGAAAITKGPTLRDQEQAACYNDVQRLCSADIPDEAKITSCMERRKSEVSKGCLKFFKK